MKETGARGALLAWGGSLLLHGLALAALLWWLDDALKPADPVARPVPMSLSMLVEAVPKPVEPMTEPVLKSEPVVEPVQPEPVLESDPETIPEPEPAPVEPVPPKPEVKPLTPKPKAQTDKPRVKPAPSTPQPVTPPLAVSNETVNLPAPAPVASSETQSQTVLEPVLPAPLAPAAMDDAEAAYKAQVRQAVAERKHYPRLARRMGEEGRVVVEFTLEHSGALVTVRIKQSSGSERLDEAALQAVRDAAPFPPFPEGRARQHWEFSLPLSFSLRE